MPWHLSKSDPRKVYDERHQTVCVCMTVEQAALIVGRVNGYAEGGEVCIKKRAMEPDDRELFIPLAPAIITPIPPRHLHAWTEDECCGSQLAKASRSGVLNSLTSWTCPKCGCDWNSAQVGPVRHWSPAPLMAILR